MEMAGLAVSSEVWFKPETATVSSFGKKTFIQFLPGESGRNLLWGRNFCFSI